MTIRGKLTVGLTLVVTLVFCVSAFAQRPLAEKEIMAIKQVGRDFNEAFARNDKEAAAKMYAPDIIRMPPDGPPIKGRDAVLKTWESLDFVTKSWTYTSEEIKGNGDIAYERGSWKWTNTKANDPRAIPTTYVGSCISIYQRQPDGSWLIAAESWSVHDKYYSQ